MSEQNDSQYDQLLDASARELCRFKGWVADESIAPDLNAKTTNLELARGRMKQYVDHFYEALALNNASQALHGPEPAEPPKNDA